MPWLRLLALGLMLVSVTARAQTTPPPPLPNVPDEPLPEWHPPAHKLTTPLFLSEAPEMRQAQKQRQAGLWISSIGWIQLPVAGILYAAAVDVNTNLGYPNPTLVFDVAGEDKRNRLEAASLALVITGGAMALGGFALFTSAQARIAVFHKRRPKEPLPPLSGY